MFLENLVLGGSYDEARAACQKIITMGVADNFDEGYLTDLDALIRIHECLERQDPKGARQVQMSPQWNREKFVSLYLKS